MAGGNPSLLGKRAAEKAAAARPAAPAPKRENRFYKVLEDKQVPRTGGHDLLRAGKEIQSANYDVDLLRKQGVKLEEIEVPAWYVDQQEQSAARHAALTDAGHELGDHPDYKPAKVGRAAGEKVPEGSA